MSADLTILQAPSWGQSGGTKMKELWVSTRWQRLQVLKNKMSQWIIHIMCSVVKTERTVRIRLTICSAESQDTYRLANIDSDFWYSQRKSPQVFSDFLRVSSLSFSVPDFTHNAFLQPHENGPEPPDCGCFSQSRKDPQTEEVIKCCRSPKSWTILQTVLCTKNFQGCPCVTIAPGVPTILCTQCFFNDALKHTR